MVKRILLSIVSLFFSLIMYAIWGVGSHGKFLFRPNRLEDWIYLGGIICGISVTIIFWYKYIVDRKNEN